MPPSDKSVRKAALKSKRILLLFCIHQFNTRAYHDSLPDVLLLRMLVWSCGATLCRSSSFGATHPNVRVVGSEPFDYEALLHSFCTASSVQGAFGS